MLLEFGGSAFYIDLEKFNELITTTTASSRTEVETKKTFDQNGTLTSSVTTEMIFPSMDGTDNVKYDLIKMFIEYVIDYESEHEDDAMGVERALSQTPLGYKIVFNTLIQEGIIKEI